jgi:zinc transporter, ZIP family
MVNDFINMQPVIITLFATLCTWGSIALGAATVFLFRKVNRRVLDGSLGLAAGIMISVSFFSLLAPAIVLSAHIGVPTWFPVTVGFLLGGVVLWLTDKILPHVHPGCPIDEAEGIRTTWRRNRLLVLALTLHHIPEGLAVGVAFGSAFSSLGITSLGAAITLAIGIAIQNFPEGIAAAMPLRGEGMSRKKSFFYGQLSGIVEPVAGVAGVLLVTISQPILPYALGFAAGAMIFVTIEDLIPECQSGGNTDLATLFAMLGFALMMVLSVSLG